MYKKILSLFSSFLGTKISVTARMYVIPTAALLIQSARGTCDNLITLKLRRQPLPFVFFPDFL